MFENLTDKLQRAFKTLRGQGTLTEENIAEALREIRVALLEADVNLNVARDLIEQIRVKAVGTEVLTALSPSEQVIKIVRDELIELLGKDTARFKFASQPPTVILMAGLQGSGKTTTSGKLAAWLKKGGHRPMLVSVDVYRPAAREQLKVVAKSIEAKLYEGDQKGEAPVPRSSSVWPRKPCAKPASWAATRSSWTPPAAAHRRRPDDEMERLKKLLNPSEILFIADAMTGQDAVNSAQDFHKRLGLTGVILTKMDGDARGGAALSIRHVTGQPIKFIGVGEKPDAFEPFHPDRIVGRILGMGDMMSLIEKAESTLDRKKSEEFAKKACSATASRSKISATSCADQEDGLHGEHPQDAAFRWPVRRHAAGRRQRGRKAVCAPRSHHQLHDAARAPQPRDHQRQPPQAHRQRQRHRSAGRQQSPPPIRADGQNVQADGQRRPGRKMMRGGLAPWAWAANNGLGGIRQKRDKRRVSAALNRRRLHGNLQLRRSSLAIDPDNRRLLRPRLRAHRQRYATGSRANEARAHS
jgi:signal recognition particle subunit SRP54